MFFTTAVYEALEDTAPLPALFVPSPSPEIPIGQRLLTAIQSALCYSVVVEYIGARGDAPIPLGVIVLCRGLKYAQAWFYRPNIALAPESPLETGGCVD